MRFLKVIVLGLMAVFALAAGLFAAVTMAAITAVRLITGAHRRRSQHPPSSPTSSAMPRGPTRMHATATADRGEVIDVVAHEVPASSDPHAR